jgi:hypothetical protein
MKLALTGSCKASFIFFCIIQTLQYEKFKKHSINNGKKNGRSTKSLAGKRMKEEQFGMP